MNELQIYDMSSIVYTGATGMQANFYGVPVGGIQYFLKHLAVAIKDRDSVVPCFDSPSFRMDLMPDYKSGRMKDPGIYHQIEVLYDGLRACGVKCEKYDGYEADDLIEWAVAENREKFIRGVTIYSSDHDICHSIRDGVMQRTLRSGMSDVMPSNFETAIERGKRIPYNTISAYKVFVGCKSDSIPAFVSETGLRGSQLYSVWCESLRRIGNLSSRNLGANPDSVRAFAKSVKAFTERDMQEIERRIKLVFPADRPAGVSIVPTPWSDIDLGKLGFLCSKYNARDALRCLGIKPSDLSEEDKNALRSEARALSTGAYAVDKNLQHETRSVKSSLLDLDSFSRGFTG